MNASLCGPFFNYYLGEIHITIYNLINSMTYSMSPRRRLYENGSLFRIQSWKNLFLMRMGTRYGLRLLVMKTYNIVNFDSFCTINAPAPKFSA